MGVKKYPLIVGILMATLLLPVTVVILVILAFRGRRERKLREAKARER
jgi:hypothetical protein